ncbi:MAG: DUF1207 domain-containing protein [Gemmatimonadota bacterium]
MSAHAGDDYLSRFPQPLEKVGYEGVELALARRSGAARVYVGGELNWEKEPIVERSAVRLGVELDPTLSGPLAGPRPFAAFDLRMTDKAVRLEGTGVAGVVVPAASFRLRFGAQGHFGPSGLGQLRRTEEEFLGIGLHIETGRSPLP